ncbi:hypothetical protein AVEN_85950-1 [Araneus ventricosus]|uniref:Uncharacterized protein n=1 Tax=Araneus ventricosus TaxID=182803 RepID=A0A4Y2NXL3_ARAVE|nr:hypothetical protein AVEN_85950-1 [Araneus ventricosus]
MLFTCHVTLMTGKKVLQRFLLQAKLLESARIMAQSPLGTEISREFDVTSSADEKSINTEELKRVNQCLFGVLSAAQAGELIDEKRC